MRPRFVGFVWCLVALALTVVFVNFLNVKAKRSKKKNYAIEAVEIKRKKKARKHIEHHIKKEIHRKPSRPKQALMPPPMLNTSITGVEISMPQLDFNIDLSNIDRFLASSNDDALVMTTDIVDTPPRAIEMYSPEYPKKARHLGIEGFVLFSVLVDENGAIRNLQVIESQPPGIFDQAAIKALKQWRFKPAYYKGKAVKVWAQQKIEFRLR